MGDPSGSVQPVEGRSAGKAPLAGRLRIGQIVSVGPHAKASIPSRFETILNTGPRERDAFGSRVGRFEDSGNDLPGPGTYKKPRTLMHHTPSQSKKGTGTFASGSKITAEQPRALFISPGPGAYQRPPGPGDPIEMPTGNPSPAFARPVPKRAIAVPPANLKPPRPGPGDYELPAPGERVNFSRAGQTAVFGSKTHRDDKVIVRLDAPGPGEYVAASEHLAVGAAAREPKVESAVFRSSTNRDGQSMNPRPPQLLDLGELAKTLPPPPLAGPDLFQVHRTASPRHPQKATDLLRVDRTPSPPPVTVADEILARKRRPKPSSVFAPTVLDRFGRPTVRYVPEDVDPPGPGHYGPEQVAEVRKALISSSWAMSGIERFEPPLREKWKPPGPAFYEPGLPPERAKSSFHMNTKGVWVQ
eukprot:TRINITY_DN22941_c0_g1_i1.p1 TRINITY_DN22941_c0_g1~~TRINITY_DN22941_c0_g1_i1.p1  ORF type:complete len:440 (+),score=100.07 TRINITY_DN22941_c0_g1_i1:78-1322(+)